MQLIPFLYPAIMGILMLGDDVNAAKKIAKDAILLSNVKSLTLHASKKTSHRRVPAVPQLSCQGPACKHHNVDIMRCTNQGADYSAQDIQWSCTANLPAEFKLGGTEVICEGYENTDDERVLKGSCAVEYRLLLTEEGEERYGTHWWGGAKSKAKSPPLTVLEDGSSGWAGTLFTLVFVAVAAWIIYNLVLACLNAPPTPRQPRQPGWGGWGGGGGGGGGGGPWDDPPPPYPGKRSSGYGQQQEQWRPGFWTGAATGAAAGYMAGNRGQREERPAVRNTGWFGSGGGESSARPSGSRNGGSGSGSSSGSGGARYESTGFGSTSRR